MKTALLYLGFAIALAVAGCARYAHGSAKVALGMTPIEVQRACGQPYSRSSNSHAVHWYYHDAAWDDSERKWERGSQFTDIVFIGDRVAAFGPVRGVRDATPSPAGATPRATPSPAAGTHRASPHHVDTSTDQVK